MTLKEQWAAPDRGTAGRTESERRDAVTFLGDGVPVFRELIAEKLQIPYSFAPAHVNKQRAAAVAALGSIYYKEGRTETAMEHIPEYLRVSQAERERAEREKAAETGRDNSMILREMLVDDLDQVMEIEQDLFHVPWTKEGFFTFLTRDDAMFLVVEEKEQDIWVTAVFLWFWMRETLPMWLCAGTDKKKELALF